MKGGKSMKSGRSNKIFILITLIILCLLQVYTGEGKEIERAGEVVPLAYYLNLKTDMDSGYKSLIKIRILVKKTTKSITLHSVGLEFQSVTANGTDMDWSMSHENSTVTIFNKQRKYFELGNCILAFKYSSKFKDGLHYLKDPFHPNSSIVFTNFEPISARTVFPCFDQPRWKTEFHTSISVPSEY
jgi:aminopeptidase N